MPSVVETFMAKASVDKKGWTSGMEAMKKSSTKFRRAASLSFKSAMKSARKMGSAMKSAAKVGAAGLAAAGAVAIGFASKSIQSASAFEEASSKFDTVFKEQAAASRAWSNQFAKDVGISKTEVIKFMGATQDLFVPLGFARDKAADFSQKVVSLSADLASFNNLKTEDVVRDIHSALTGSSETMKKYGVVINQTKLGQELMNMGIKGGTKDATDQQKAMATLNLILRGTTDAQGDAVKTAGSFANTTKRLWARIEDLQVSIGQKLLPVVTPMVDKMGKWIAANEGWISTEIGNYVGEVATKIKTWSEDGTFLLWWERAKLAALGLKVVLAGVQSSLDYMIYGVYKAMEAKNDLQYLWEGNTKKGYEAARRASEYGRLANEYKDQGSSRSVAAVNEYAEQVRRVQDVQDRNRSRRTISAEPPTGGGTVVNVNVENKGLQRIENKEADMIAEAVRRRMVRGKVKSLAGAR